MCRVFGPARQCLRALLHRSSPLNGVGQCDVPRSCPLALPCWAKDTAHGVCLLFARPVRRRPADLESQSLQPELEMALLIRNPDHLVAVKLVARRVTFAQLIEGRTRVRRTQGLAQAGVVCGDVIGRTDAVGQEVGVGGRPLHDPAVPARPAGRGGRAKNAGRPPPPETTADFAFHRIAGDMGRDEIGGLRTQPDRCEVRRRTRPAPSPPPYRRPSGRRQAGPTRLRRRRG